LFHIAGIGGGGIVSAVWVITSEIVEVQNRAKWSQALSITWSCSAVAGPLLGGLFSSSLFLALFRFLYKPRNIMILWQTTKERGFSAGDGAVSYHLP
jgi:MFS family permease